MTIEQDARAEAERRYEFTPEMPMDVTYFERREGCLEWTGYVNKDGYGWLTRQRKQRFAHVHAWNLVHGAVPAGLELDHLCRNRRCVDIAHLEAVTHQENMLRSSRPRFGGVRCEACPAGHPYEGSNVRFARGQQICVTCKRKSDRESARRRRERSNVQ